MDNYSEQKIEQTLQMLAELQPSAESSRRMQETVRNRIAARCRSDQSLLQKLKPSAWSLAAAIVIAAALFTLLYPTPPAPPSVQPGALSLTSLGSLNAAFEEGGMEAVDQLFKEYMKTKKPEPEIKSIDDAMNGQSEKEK